MPTPIRTFIICPGLGRINRGYETFAQESFEALSRDDRLEVCLFKGHGPKGPRERAVGTLDRRGVTARALGVATGKSGYYWEQLAFLVGLAPYLKTMQPQVVFFSDVNLRTPLWHWRRMKDLSYRLLLSNGGPIGPPFPRCEHVHQVLPTAVEDAVKAGCPYYRQTFIPYGFNIPSELAPLSQEEQRSVRMRLNLPLGREILLSVGAINSSHKRMDYIVREVALLPAELRPFLVILGQPEPETPQVIRAANELLGPDGFWIGTVSQNLLADYYLAANRFLSASLSEGFGRVYVEALARGLPCMAHDSEAARYILGDQGLLADMEVSGTAAALLRSRPPFDESLRQRRHQTAFDRFSWMALRDKYVQMVLRCSAEPLTVSV